MNTELDERQLKALKKADELTDRQLRCRDLGHNWTLPFSDSDVDTDNKLWNRHLTCTTCKTERFDIVDFTGIVLKRRYRYTAGYQLKGSGGILHSSDFRQRLFERIWNPS